MTRFISNHLRTRCVFETLEDRTLLASGIDLDLVRQAYPDFTIADTVSVDEIKAVDLSAVQLQNAITRAQLSEGDDLIVLHTTGTQNTIALTTDSEFVIEVEGKGTLTIISWGPDQVTLDANGLTRLFTIRSGSCQLGGLVLDNGLTQKDLQGKDSWFGMGGGLANAGNTILDQVTIRDCAAQSAFFSPDIEYMSYYSKGGGIYNAGTLTIIDSVLQDNVAKSSGLDNTNNTAYGAGGALYNQDGVVAIRDSTLLNNRAEAKEIAYTVSGKTETTMYVRQEGCGGAIYSLGGSISMDGVTISGNTACLGGGIAAFNSVLLDLTGVLMEKNEAISDGGGIFLHGISGSIIANGCDFVENGANRDGAAVYSRSVMLFQNSIFSGNIAGRNGGAFAFYGKYVQDVDPVKFNLLNCTITGNQAGQLVPGNGGGIFFSGIDSGQTAAKLYLQNSILVENRVVNTDVSPDFNFARASETDYCFCYYTLTTFDRWTLSGNNPEYNEDLPLFYRPYQFETGTVGDYRLLYQSNSQVIDTGYTDYVKTELDFSGNIRVQGSAVDLGALEHSPSVFDGLYPSELQVDEGASLVLNASGVDLQGNLIVRYYVDLNGDGISDMSGDSLWIASHSISIVHDGTGYIFLAMENDKGTRGDFVAVPVVVLDVLPTISVKLTAILDGRILRLNLIADYYARTGKVWTISWGDGSASSEYHILSNSLTAAHLYASTTNSFRITLHLVDSNGNDGDNFVHDLGTYSPRDYKMSAAALPCELVEPVGTNENELQSVPLPVDLFENDSDPDSVDLVAMAAVAMPVVNKENVFDRALIDCNLLSMIPETETSNKRRRLSVPSIQDEVNSTLPVSEGISVYLTESEKSVF